MSVERVDYRHICKDEKNNPKVVGAVMAEAVKVFMQKVRGINGAEFRYNEGHPVTLSDLAEIGAYFEKIWNNEEIYMEI